MKRVFVSFLWVFYVAIILYVFFAVLKINALENFVSALIFEIIGFVALAYFVFCNMFLKPIKMGYLVPLIMTTVIYTIVLDIVNIACVTKVDNVFFVLINLVLLFVYCLVSIPMYLMGRK